ncbi:MAG: hypothetical protein CMK07_16605 [Ponticaulis sp.]|nr:hypothetical protein [Ponticaulis sp.]
MTVSRQHFPFRKTFNCLRVPAACAFAALLTACTPSYGETQLVSPDEWDILITNARIVDGTGSPWYRGSVGVDEGKIVWIGTSDKAPAEALERVDANDYVLSPGFVDMMGQESLPYLTNPASGASKLMQGITLHASGEGYTSAPNTDATQPEPRMIQGKPYSWTSFDEYFEILEFFGVPVNVVHNVGATQVRLIVIGEEDREATPGEIRQMQALIAEAMDQGASGLSSALIYPPGLFQSTEELTELARAIKPYGGVYSTHMRNESSRLLEAIEEAITIGREAEVPVHIYHLKAAGLNNWPLMEPALILIAKARAEGIDVTTDIYPYLRNGLGLGAFLPPESYAQGWDSMKQSLSDPETRSKYRTRIEEGDDFENWYHHVGKDWGNVQIISTALGEDLNGLSIADAAELSGTDVWSFVFDTVMNHEVAVAPYTMNIEQKYSALRYPFVMFDTDMSPVSSAGAHPRGYGSMARVLAKYVREDKALTLEDAIRRLTSTAANRLGVFDRGQIAVGMAADLVLFDPDTVQDTATYADPAQYPTGIRHVWVNGQYAVKDGAVTEARAGHVIRFGRASTAQ